MKSDLKALYPVIYRGIVETDALSAIGDKQFDDWFGHMDQAYRDQFVMLASPRGLSWLERVYEIRATAGEDMDFRRQRLLVRMNTVPPFTIRFLRERLDEIIGPGMHHTWVGFGQYNYQLGSWRLGELPFETEPYVLNIETALSNREWYQEVEALVGKVKQAHVVYNYVPLVNADILIAEEIIIPKVVWNYKLNGGWRLGQKPFRSDTEELTVKMPSTTSLQQDFLADHAQFTAQEITSALINDSIAVTDLQISVSENATLVRYTAPPDIGEITNLKLLKSDGSLCSSANVFIAATAEQVTIKHTFTHKEGA